MVEDIELTKRILQETAKTDSFPASLDEETLRAVIYPDDGNLETMRNVIRYHIILARDNGLIFGGEYDVDRHMGLSMRYRVSPVDGLTSLGMSYLGYLESESILKKTMDTFKAASVKATTQEMVKFMMREGFELVTKAL